MKPKNFPERKRRRQLRAKERGEPNANPAPRSLRDVRTKKQLATGSVARRERHAGKIARR